MRVLVTGADGFIGRHLVPALRVAHEPLALTRRGESRTTGDTLLVDLSEPRFEQRLPAGVEAVVHLAQGGSGRATDGREQFAVNVASTFRLANYARRAGASCFILASTGSVYRRSCAALGEDAPTSGADVYAATKSAAEVLLEPFAKDFAVVALRLFVPYGPGQTGRMIPNIVEAVREGRPVVITNGGQPRSNPVYVDDVVAIVEALLSQPLAGPMNVAGPEVVSIRAIAELAGQALGVEPRFEHRTDEPWDLIAETTRLRQYVPTHVFTPPVAGIRQTIAAMYGHA